MPVSSFELLAVCTEAYQGGKDFQSIWKTLLESHPLVSAPARQYASHDGPVLVIPLLTGQGLVFGRYGFSLGQDMHLGKIPDDAL